jgi:uncharacterized protein with GYD domain
MTHYLIQWTYKDPQVKALVDTPHDRAAELGKVVGAFGGRVHDFYFSIGEFDGMAIVEFPDTESCEACLLILTGEGANARLKTTVLVTPAEGQRAMARAGSVVSGYRPPVGYASYG